MDRLSFLSAVYFFAPCIFQRHRAIEDQFAITTVRIEIEVSDALKLKVIIRFGLCQLFLYETVGQHLQRIGIEQFMKIFFFFFD